MCWTRLRGWNLISRTESGRGGRALRCLRVQVVTAALAVEAGKQRCGLARLVGECPNRAVEFHRLKPDAAGFGRIDLDDTDVTLFAWINLTPNLSGFGEGGHQAAPARFG